jgi:hypothetical protein
MNHAMGYVQLAEALRAQIDSLTKLLGIVLDMWAKSGSEGQPGDALGDLVPITDIEQATGGKITINKARWLARNRNDNGLTDTFVKIGRTLYIDLQKFKVWLSSQGGAA